MSREEEIAKIDTELEKLGLLEEGDEILGEEVADEEDSTEEVVEEQEEGAIKEQPKEEKKEPIKLEVNTDLPASTLGYKLREEARKREALEREIQELKAPKVSREDNYEGFIENEIGITKQEIAELKQWRQEQEAKRQEDEQREGAFRELRGYEDEAAKAFDDYAQASNYVKSMIAASIKFLNPDISQDDLAEKTIFEYARQAGKALSEKRHPGQAIYETAQKNGYKRLEEAKQEIKQDNRPTITKIGENKKKSAGMSTTGGNGKAFMTMEVVNSMTNAERMKLSESDWARLEAEG